MLTSTVNQLWGVVTLNLYCEVIRKLFRKLFQHNKELKYLLRVLRRNMKLGTIIANSLTDQCRNSFGEIIKCNLGNLCSMENCRFVIFLTSTFIYRNWFVSAMSTLNYARKTCDINHGFFRLSDQECKMLLPSMNMPRHYTSIHHSQNQPH